MSLGPSECKADALPMNHRPCQFQAKWIKEFNFSVYLLPRVWAGQRKMDLKRASPSQRREKEESARPVTVETCA